MPDSPTRFRKLSREKRKAVEAITTMKTQFNGHSMSGALQRVMVCSPRTAGWNQPERASRWQELGFRHALDFARAQSQHDALCHELKAAGAEVVELPPSPNLSLDAVYTNDASLPADHGLIVMRPGKPNRLAEGPPQALLCDTLDIPTLRQIIPPHTTLSTSNSTPRSSLPPPPKPSTCSGSIPKLCSSVTATAPMPTAFDRCAT